MIKLRFDSVRQRLVMLFVLLSAVATVSVGGYFIFSIIEQNEEASASYRTMMEDAFDREIKLQTEGLVSSLNGIYEEQKAGALTEEQAKKLAIATIKANRYDNGKGYFFADDKATGVCVAHATLGAKVEGKRRIDDKDSHGDYHDICFPCTKEARQQFNDAVLNAYEQSLRQAQQPDNAPAAEQVM